MGGTLIMCLLPICQCSDPTPGLLPDWCLILEPSYPLLRLGTCVHILFMWIDSSQAFISSSLAKLLLSRLPVTSMAKSSGRSSVLFLVSSNWIIWTSNSLLLETHSLTCSLGHFSLGSLLLHQCLLSSLFCLDPPRLLDFLLFRPLLFSV